MLVTQKIGFMEGRSKDAKDAIIKTRTVWYNKDHVRRAYATLDEKQTMIELANNEQITIDESFDKTIGLLDSD